MVVCPEKKTEEHKIFFRSVHNVLLVRTAGKGILNPILNLALTSFADEFLPCQRMICDTSLRNSVFNYKSFYLALCIS